MLNGNDLDILYKLISKSYEPKEVDFSFIKNSKSVLIIRSASYNVFNGLLKTIRNYNNNIEIYVLTDKSLNIGEYKAKWKIKDFFIYDGSESLNVNNLTKQIDRIIYSKIEDVLVLYNNILGAGYDNIHEIAIQLVKNNHFYAYNTFGQLMMIENIEKHNQSKKTSKALVEWFWSNSDLCINMDKPQNDTFQNVLLNLINSLDEYKFNVVDPLKVMENGPILIFRSGSMEILKNCVDTLHNIDIDYKSQNYILSYSRDIENINKLFNGKIPIIEYNEGQQYKKSIISDMENKFKKLGIKTIIIISNKKYGRLYNHILDLFAEFNNKYDFIIYDNFFNFYKINNLSGWIASDLLYFDIINWFWNYHKDCKEISK